MRNVLLIAPRFHGYSLAIKQKLIGMHFKVYLLHDLSASKVHGLFKRYISTYYLKYLSLFESFSFYKIRNKNFDYIFIIRGMGVTEKYLINMKQKYPSARYILYQWDSIENYDYANIIKYFNICYTFDPCDARNIPGLKYLALFYLEKYETNIAKFHMKYTFTFIGGFSFERYHLLSSLVDYCEQEGIEYYFKLYLPIVFRVKFRIFGTVFKKNMLTSKIMSSEEIRSVYSQSGTIIDIHDSGQSGLTIRTIESLAMGKILITTNGKIAVAPFFNSEQICILKSETKWESIYLFSQTKQESLINMENYSLSSWLNHIFSMSELKN